MIMVVVMVWVRVGSTSDSRVFACFAAISWTLTISLMKVRLRIRTIKECFYKIIDLDSEVLVAGGK